MYGLIFFRVKAQQNTLLVFAHFSKIRGEYLRGKVQSDDKFFIESKYVVQQWSLSYASVISKAYNKLVRFLLLQRFLIPKLCKVYPKVTLFYYNVEYKDVFRTLMCFAVVYGVMA